MTPAQEARTLLRSRPFGVLATVSRELPGYPFGSITPFALDRKGNPLLLIAAIAQHTKNIDADSRVSLTVWDEVEGDQQTGARLTWVGDASPIGDDPEEKARYVRFLPASAGYFGTHDFALYRIALTRARFIGGFGKIHWIEPGDLCLPNTLHEAEAGIVTHMNEDHADALLAFCRTFRNLDPKQVQMVGVDPEGFDLLADGRRVRFSFEHPVATADDVRKAMVALVRAAKQPKPSPG